MLRSTLFWTVFALCTVLIRADDPPRQFGPNNNGFDFFGLGGQIVLWTIDGAHWVKIRFMKLQEVNAAGQVVAQAFNFDNFGFQWTVKGEGRNWNANFTEVMLTDPNLIITPLNGNNPFPVNFQVDTFIFKNAMNTVFAGENIAAKAGQLKWQLSVAGWQFQAAANTLRFGVQLLSDSFANNAAYTKLDPVPATVSSLAIAFGKGELILPRVAMEDGKAVNVTATVLYAAGQLTVQWDFPSFTKTLLYDPVAATTDLIVGSGAAEKSASGFITVFAVLAAAWAVLRQ